MRVDDFDFELPADRIAQRPAVPRDQARLLAVGPEGLADHRILDLPALLAPGDLILFNDTKVLPARLVGQRGPARVSVTLHQRLDPRTWLVFAKPAKRLRLDDRIVFGPDFSAQVIERRPTGDLALAFDCGGGELLAALHRHGAVPLPPYIRGGIADEQDKTDYQTLFARAEGSVAAPTAALHFTPRLIEALGERGIAQAMVTLHVGAGTFLPVKVAETADHVMHAEVGEIPAETAEAIARTRRAGGRIVAVGTTVTRLIETAAAETGSPIAWSGSTRLFITPGYRFRAVDRLITNFHLPRSTLFMLVAGFAGLETMRRAYAHAIAQEYRFYSYGDACLLSPEAGP